MVALSIRLCVYIKILCVCVYLHVSICVCPSPRLLKLYSHEMKPD